MRDSGRTIQVQQLAGRDYIVSWSGFPRSEELPLYGALMLADDSDEPVAVIVHTKTAVVEVPGLRVAHVEEGPAGTKQVTYMAANSLDPRPDGPGYFHENVPSDSADRIEHEAR